MALNLPRLSVCCCGVYYHTQPGVQAVYTIIQTYEISNIVHISVSQILVLAELEQDWADQK